MCYIRWYKYEQCDKLPVMSQWHLFPFPLNRKVSHKPQYWNFAVTFSLRTCNIPEYSNIQSSFCLDMKCSNLDIQLGRLQIDTRKQGTIIILDARVVDRSPALSWSRRFVAGRMMRGDRSRSTSVQIPTRYKCAHIHIMGKYVMAYQLREKMYQIGKHGSVLCSWVVFCNEQRTKGSAYTHNSNTCR